MHTIKPIFKPQEKKIDEHQPNRPLVSLVAAAYNEETIMMRNSTLLCEYMESLEDQYSWEMIIVNDGSTDQTGDLAEAFAGGRENIRVFHHVVNFGLGQALRTAFNQCRGDYVVTMDMDLSYSPDHIESLLYTIGETKADVVIASPYMKGGKTSNVPLKRLLLSKCANRFLSFFAPGKLSTLTGMVRVYEEKLLKKICLKANGFEINTEIIYKAWLLRSRIIEIPAHLDWSELRGIKRNRKSSFRILRTSLNYFSSGFMFKPFQFFRLSVFAFAVISLYSIARFIAYAFVH